MTAVRCSTSTLSQSSGWRAPQACPGSHRSVVEKAVNGFPAAWLKEPVTGEVFGSVDECRERLNAHALAQGFFVVTTHSANKPPCATFGCIHRDEKSRNWRGLPERVEKDENGNIIGKRKRNVVAVKHSGCLWSCRVSFRSIGKRGNEKGFILSVRSTSHADVKGVVHTLAEDALVYQRHRERLPEYQNANAAVTTVGRLGELAEILSAFEEASAVESNGSVLGQALLDELRIRDSAQWPVFGELGLETAEEYLKRYNRMARAVPFAIQTTSLDMTESATSRPILLLAKLLTGSSSDPKIEKEADNLFRHVLADRVIVKGKKSLELLQSLLTYMNWYHHRFDIETNQFYQFLQLANGMVVDLGLPKKFASTEAALFHQTESLDECRAFLLCYYLNCGAGILGYDRAENMRCVGSLRNAARLLVDTTPLPQEREAPAVVEMLHIVASYHSVDNTPSPDGPPATSMSLLGDWETTYLHDGTSATLRSSFHFVTAYTMLKSSKARVLSSETVQTCKHHFQELLVNILGQDLNYLVNLGIVEWAHLITSLFLLARLGSTGSIEARRQNSVYGYVHHFQTLARILGSDGQKGGAYGASHLLGWLERILVAVSERADAWEASEEQSAAEIGHQGSAYELVNSFLESGRNGIARPQQASINMDGGDFWNDFMSDWLVW